MADATRITIPATLRSRVMRRAWEIFRETYDFPRMPFRSIGRACFQWALKAAWAEAQRLAALAAYGVGHLNQMLVTLDTPVHRVGLSTSMWGRSDELIERARQRREITAALAFAPSF